MADVVKIGCPFPQGVELKLQDKFEVAPGIFEWRQRPGADVVVLKAGENEVTAAFWREWAEQNKDGPLLAQLQPKEEVPDDRKETTGDRGD